MGTMLSQITSRTIVYSTVYSGADQRKHQISALLAFVSPGQGHPTLQGQPVLKSKLYLLHYNDVIMSVMVSLITGASIVYSTVCSAADQRKYQRSASLAFVRGIHRWPVNSPHKWPVAQKMFPFDDVIMENAWLRMYNLNQNRYMIN